MKKIIDLTKVKCLDELEVGNLTWVPRERQGESHRRGLIESKGNRSILVTEHYHKDYDKAIDERVYLFDKESKFHSGKFSADTHSTYKEFSNNISYVPLVKKLKEAGVKIHKK